MKRIFLTSLLFLLPFAFTNTVFADIGDDEQVEVLLPEEYTVEDVAEHATEDDCWMIFEDGVYDLSSYISDHEKFLDIREWCGKDMTEDFKNKAGADRNHKTETYQLLKLYWVGFLTEEEQVEILPEEYSMSEVAMHNTEDDCWVVFEDGVYDLSEYVDKHDKFLDIRGWCGIDMTDDFKDKAGAGRDHKEGAYELLKSYMIGNLRLEKDIVLEEISPLSLSKEYNILIPFLLTTVLYWGGFVLVRRRSRARRLFNGFWNTVLLLTLFIPAMGFGLFMVLRTQYSQLWDIDFDFMFWHVELSLVMGFAAIYHLVQRTRMYLAQFKKEVSS